MKQFHRGVFSIDTEVPVAIVTGLYASGKSTFAKRLAELGNGLYVSGDDLWKDWFYVESRREELCDFFGQDVLLESGAPNFPLLRSIFFNSPNCEEVRQAVNREYGFPFMLHLVQTVLTHLADHKDAGIVVIESDRAIQSCWHQLFNNSRVVAVKCPAWLRLDRAIGRSVGQGRDDSKSLHETIMRSQYSDAHFLELSAAVNAIPVANHSDGKTYLGYVEHILKELKVSV